VIRVAPEFFSLSYYKKIIDGLTMPRVDDNIIVRRNNMTLYTLVTIGWIVIFAITGVVYIWPKKSIKTE